MPDDADPPRKFYDFKPRSFENVNAPTGKIPATGKIDVRDHFRQAATPRPAAPVPPEPAKAAVPPSAPAPVPAANDVHALLRDNLARETAAGLHHVPLRPRRPSRRKRDYFILIAIINVGFLPLAFLSRNNPMVFICALSGSVFLSAGVSWIMWVLMDDY